MSDAKGAVLITGSAKRLGRVIALRMAQTGWDVVVHAYQSLKEAEEVAREIAAMGRRAFIAQADFQDNDSVQRLIPLVNKSFGSLTALVNNASLFEPDTNDPDGERHRRINAESPALLNEFFYRQLPANLSGAIVNIIDEAPLPPLFSAYAKSKDLLGEVTIMQARRMAPRVRVNAVALGPVMINPRQSPAHFDRLIASTALKSSITPEAVAAGIAFLIDNPSITGDIIHIDGGRHLMEEA